MSNSPYSLTKKYPKDTLGYHWAHCVQFLGPESKATKWLEEKADNSFQGMDEPVMQHESQVVFLLLNLHNDGGRAP